MNRIAACALVLASLVLAACSPQSPPPATPSAALPAAASRKAGTIRFSQTGDPNVRDLPWLMALDSLREQGYTVEVIPFAKTSLIPPALDKGDIEMASASTVLSWAAAAQGADIRSIVGGPRIGYYLIAGQEIASCHDLDKRPITFSTRQSVGYVMFEKYVAQNCPGIAPEVPLISESQNRVVALQVGQVAAAYLDLEDYLKLQKAAPDKFHVVIDFGQEFPQVQFLTFNAKREWAERNPTMVKDFVRALLQANRSVIGNPTLVRDGIVKYLSFEAAQAQEQADVYVAAKIWEPNGGTTTETIEYTLQFLHAGGILTAGSKVEDVVDLSYLNAVLDEIGRQ